MQLKSKHVGVTFGAGIFGIGEARNFGCGKRLFSVGAALEYPLTG